MSSRDLITAKNFTINETAAAIEQTNNLSTENIEPCVKDGAHDHVQFLIQQGAKRNLSQNLTIGLFRKYLLERAQQYMQFRDGEVLKEAPVNRHQPTNCQGRHQPTNCQGLLPYQNTSRKPSFLELGMLPQLRHPKVHKLDCGQASKGQMTIFYSGTVYVYDNIPDEKANEIMQFAGESKSMASSSTVTVTRSKMPAVAPNVSPTQYSNDNPPPCSKIETGSCATIARGYSLQRFLEKRRDSYRMINKGPDNTCTKRKIDQETAKEGDEQEVYRAGGLRGGLVSGSPSPTPSSPPRHPLPLCPPLRRCHRRRRRGRGQRLSLFFIAIVSQRRGNMSLACLCYSVDSPSHSIRSYSVSSSDSDGRCSAMVSCLRKVSALHDHGSADMTSKVYPQPIVVAGQGLAGAPRLVRSRAVRRDFVRDWNFDDVLGEN